MVARSAGIASASVITKKFRRMKLELETKGSSLFDRLRSMELDIKGSKKIEHGKVLVEVSPAVHKSIKTEDDLNKMLLKKLESISADDPAGLPRFLSSASKLIVLTCVPGQYLGVLGGVLQRAYLYDSTAAKALPFLPKMVDKVVKGRGHAMDASWRQFMGHSYVKEKLLKDKIYAEARLLERIN